MEEGCKHQPAYLGECLKCKVEAEDYKESTVEIRDRLTRELRNLDRGN